MGTDEVDYGTSANSKVTTENEIGHKSLIDPPYVPQCKKALHPFDRKNGPITWGHVTLTYVLRSFYNWLQAVKQTTKSSCELPYADVKQWNKD